MNKTLPTNAPARVLIIQEPMKRQGLIEVPAFDFTPAEKFGELEVLAPNGRMIFQPTLMRKHIEAQLDEMRFDPKRDYVLPVGDYSVLLLVGMILRSRTASLQVLRWVPSAREYQPLIFDLS